MAFISEVSYSGNRTSDFVEVMVPEGTDVSGWAIEVYNNGGKALRSISFDSPVSTIDGQDVYIFEGSGALGSVGKNNGIALVDNTGTVQQFISLEGNDIDARDGAADGQTSTNIGTAESRDSLQTLDGGSSYVAQSPSPGVMPCFGPGTRILTPEGWRRVEDLKTGDLVNTLDRGVQPIAWTCSSSQAIEPDEGPYPILINRDGRFWKRSPRERSCTFGAA